MELAVALALAAAALAPAAHVAATHDGQQPDADERGAGGRQLVAELDIVPAHERELRDLHVDAVRHADVRAAHDAVDVDVGHRRGELGVAEVQVAPPMTLTTVQRRATRQRPLRSLPPMIETTQAVPPGPSRTTTPPCGARARRRRRSRRQQPVVLRQVGEQALQLATGARRVCELDALLELVDVQAPVGGRAAELLDRAFALGVGGPRLGGGGCVGSLTPSK